MTGNLVKESLWLPWHPAIQHGCGATQIWKGCSEGLGVGPSSQVSVDRGQLAHHAGRGLAPAEQTHSIFLGGHLDTLWPNLFSRSWGFVRGQIPGWGRINKSAWLTIGELAWSTTDRTFQRTLSGHTWPQADCL